ncbi:GntR family transcriptional regulator [Longispora fulva]|uniref:DNA-binding GntR family transcriptional regulator n=1 Tax=Longispora fulva TaxID=619741 RepID=A0A8J7GP89_9ACTN|nr:GntR family transcriptional regulator [Longispora fulva]MBG6141475.1 DNA-binding GntR family transcriptional regulator [Longispora fulva]
MAIERRPLRDQIKAEVLARSRRGDFPAGHNINEARLAAELGVSRTPLREALIALEIEGLIESSPGKGFRFAPVTPREYEELSPVVAALEALALESSGAAYLERTAPRLLELAEEFAASEATQAEVEQRDDEWHELLLGGCPNERLMDLITTVKASLRRYVHLKLGDETQVSRSADEHRLIAQRLIAGDLSGAVLALKANWTSGTDQVLTRIDSAWPNAGGGRGGLEIIVEGGRHAEPAAGQSRDGVRSLREEHRTGGPGGARSGGA